MRHPALPVIGVIEPGAAAAVAASQSQHIAVIGTEGTIGGGAYQSAIHGLNQRARVTAAARPVVSAFAFATRLTDLTPLLKRAGDDRLMGAIAETVRDYGGGTRIGAALRTFNERYAVRGAARGGTVVILSDGWEREDPALVGVEMARLRRLARRIVWVNPHKRHAAYEPLVRGMAAALPSIDVLLSGHSVRTLEAVAAAIEGLATTGKRSGAGAIRRRSVPSRARTGSASSHSWTQRPLLVQ